MTDDTTPAPTPDQPAPPPAAPSAAPSTDRIAKVMARAGVASRRDAERMILEGRVAVNGKRIDSPALDVSSDDRIAVDGKPLDAPQETRLWLYYKPVGLVTSESDEKGRQTVFDALPRDLPRVMTIGRLDLTSEGLLLLTNDGDLKRRLELPSTGWLRRYRVRVNGTPSDMTFAPLRRGVTIEGEDFAPMEIKLDSQQGANAWLTVGIREGRNREIRRAMTHVGLQVNRLIRIGYGPFKLTGMERNEVVEVKRRILRDQLGGLLTGEDTPKDREMRPRGAEGARAPRRDGDRPVDRTPRPAAGTGEGRRFAAKGAGEGQDRPKRPWQDRPREGKPWDGKPRQDRPADGDRPAFRGKPGADRADGDRPARAAPRTPRPEGAEDRPWFGKPARTGEGGSRRAGAAGADAPRGAKPRRDGDAPDAGRGFKGRDGGKPGGFGPRRDGPPGDGKPGGARTGGTKSGGGRDVAPRGEGKAQGGPKAGRAFGKPGGTGPAKGGPGGKPRPGGAPAGRPGGKPGGKPGGRPQGRIPR